MLFTEGRVAGLILLASLVPFVLFGVTAVRGESPATYGLFRPIEDLASRLPVSAWGLVWQLTSLILVLAGFGILTSQLQARGEMFLPLLGFGLLLVSVALTSIEGSFYQFMSPWAAQESVRTGSTPEVFQAMFKWMNTSLQIVYMLFGLVAYGAYGWSILRAGYLPPWAGWTTIGWAAGWLIFTAVSQTTLPMSVFLWPWVLGAIILSQA